MQDKDFEYEVIDHEVRIMKYHGFDSNVYIPDEIQGYKVTTIGDGCFEDNQFMKKIRLPKMLHKVEKNAFSGCSKLSELCFPCSDLIIEALAIWKCFSLRRVYISSKVNYIGAPAFMGCLKLDTIIVDEQNENYIAIDDVLFRKKPFVLLKYPEGKTDKKYIAPHIRTIADYGFSFNQHLKRVLLPSCLNIINSGAFYGSSIDKISIPDSVYVIGDSAFCCCDHLEKITLSKHLRRVRFDTFEKCIKLKEVVIPKSVRYLDCLAFNQCRDDLVVKMYHGCYLKNKDKLDFNIEMIEEK